MASLFDRITPRETPASSSGGGGSIFGGAAATSQPSGASLFGGGASTTTSQPSLGQSLFSQPATTSAGGSGGSLFGGAASTGGSGASLFGGNNANTSQAGGASLFSNTNNTTTQPTGASLFGGNTNTSQPANAGSSIFGASTGAKPFQPAGSSLFASTANNNAQNNSNCSVFGENILPSQQLQEQNAQGNYPLDAPPPKPAYFQALLNKAGNKRVADDNNGLPQLQLGLQDISRKVRNIGQGGPSAGLARDVPDTRSKYLLSASGVNVGQSLRDIEEIATMTADTRAPSLADMADYSAFSDVKDFLGQHHRSNFETMIASRLQQAKDDFDRMIDEQLHDVDWDAHRERIYEHFGLRKPQDNGESTAEGGLSVGGASFGRTNRRSRVNGASTLGRSFGLPGMSRSVIGAPGPQGARQSTFGDVAEKLPSDGMRPAPEDRTQRQKQDKYADKVKELNLARLQEKAFPIMHRFSEVEAESTSEDTSMLVNAYKALARITGEDPRKENLAEPGVVKERQFAPDYLEETATKGHVAIKKRIINGSRAFLEKLFYAQLESTVARNPREANVGGVPSALAQAKGYVRVRAARKELGPDIEILQEINGDYCWAVLFYMLRSGLYTEALQYIEENSAAFKQIDRKFASYLRAYVNSEDHRLPPDVQTAINNEYATRQRLAPEDSIDPYRMLCYKVIGRCDLVRRSLDNITNDMMDWLWLQFALAREYSRVDELAHEAFGLDELREAIKAIGERYFGPGSDIANAPTTFFFMQILACMFEKAVADLYPHNYVSATHFAIALDYYGLLRVSGDLSNDDLLTYTTRQQPQIAFGSMIGLYTRDFRTANPTAAVDYLTLICLNADLTDKIGQTQRELCYQALIELILETREFAQLLGDIRSDGRRIRGAVEQRLKLIKLDNEQEFLKHITLVAARTAEDQSRVTDATLLFHLAEDYDKVIQVVNEAVSLALTTELGEQPARLTPLKPRETGQANGNQQVDQQQSASLSLTSIDDPFQLASSMRQLYLSRAMYYDKVRNANMDCNEILLQLAAARNALLEAKWPQSLDYVSASNVLPTNAGGNISEIRGRAQAFNEMPAVLARTIGHVMLWTVVACSNEVEHTKQAEFETGSKQDTIARCVQMAKDVMVFAGLIRFKLPGRVWEMLARAGQELGAY